MTRRKQSKRNQRSDVKYLPLEARQMMSANLPDIDGQIALTREYISQAPETSFLLSDRSDLKFIDVKHGLASTTTRYQQTVDGIPVHDAYVTINQGPTGGFQRIHHELGFDTLKTEFPLDNNGVVFSVAAAETTAMQQAGVTESYLPTRGELAWYVSDTGQIHQVWDLTVYSAINPVGDFLTIVDVTSGEILEQQNMTAFASGEGHVYEPNPWQTQGEEQTWLTITMRTMRSSMPSVYRLPWSVWTKVLA